MKTLPNLDLYPLNKLSFDAFLVEQDPLTGAQQPLEAPAVVKAFIAKTNASTEVPETIGLEVDCVHTGNDEDEEYGIWLVYFPGAPMTPLLLNAQFEDGETGYVIIYDSESNVRVSVKFIYHNTADPATIKKG